MCNQLYAVSVLIGDVDNGALASWGASEFGQLGHKEGAGKVDAVQPRIVKGSRDQQFVRVACGSAHTLALTGRPLDGVHIGVALCSQCSHSVCSH